MRDEDWKEDWALGVFVKKRLKSQWLEDPNHSGREPVPKSKTNLHQERTPEGAVRTKASPRYDAVSRCLYVDGETGES